MITQYQLYPLLSPILYAHRISLYIAFACLTPGWLSGWYPFYKHELWYISILYICIPLFTSALIVVTNYDPVVFQYNYGVLCVLVMPIVGLLGKLGQCPITGKAADWCEENYFFYFYTLVWYLVYVGVLMLGLWGSLTVDLRERVRESEGRVIATLNHFESQ
jgi:hypothetical protein